MSSVRAFDLRFSAFAITRRQVCECGDEILSGKTCKRPVSASVSTPRPGAANISHGRAADLSPMDRRE